MTDLFLMPRVRDTKERALEYHPPIRVPHYAEQMDLPVSSVYAAIRRGDIPSVGLPGALRIPWWFVEQQLKAPEEKA